MENHKIDNFSIEFADRTFPAYRQLSDNETVAIQRQLIENLGLPKDTNLLSLVQTIDEQGETIVGLNAGTDQFNLLSVLPESGIYSNPKVFINWYRYNQIDELKKCDLAKEFRSIWYPSIDDIDIFDLSLTWIISIAHHGKIKICNFI